MEAKKEEKNIYLCIKEGARARVKDYDRNTAREWRLTSNKNETKRKRGGGKIVMER